MDDNEEEDLEEPFEKLSPSKCTIHSKFFNILFPIKIIIHGYTQTHEDELLVNIRQGNLSHCSFPAMYVFSIDQFSEYLKYSNMTRYIKKVIKIMQGIIGHHLCFQIFHNL